MPKMGEAVTFAPPMPKIVSFHDFVVNDLQGRPFPFSQLKGKKVLAVNTASACGYTPQYAQLEELHKEFGSTGLAIIAFPCNDFGGQEQGSAEEIVEFCEVNYGVTFPIMEKIKIKGKSPHPVYAWLTEKEQNGMSDSIVSWNFQKYAIDEEGNLVRSFAHGCDPMDSSIMQWITQTTLF